MHTTDTGHPFVRINRNDDHTMRFDTKITHSAEHTIITYDKIVL